MTVEGTPINPFSGVESTLSVDFNALRSSVGEIMGYGRDYTVWSTANSENVTQIVQRGVRQFYYPPILRGERSAHSWTFLKPTTTLATVAGQGDYDLNDNFGGLIGEITYPENQGKKAIKIVSENAIRNMRQKPDTGLTSSGKAVYAAVRPLNITASSPPAGQRFQLALFPTPTSVATLAYQYAILSDKISASNPYPFGGMAHGETILASCLSVAEQTLDNQQSRHFAGWMSRLSASVSHDRRISEPDYLGYNGNDNSGSLLGLSRRQRYNLGEW